VIDLMLFLYLFQKVDILVIEKKNLVIFFFLYWYSYNNIMIIILYFKGIRPKDLSKFEKKMYYITSLKNCCFFF
jgi:hypothetical protein